MRSNINTYIYIYIYIDGHAVLGLASISKYVPKICNDEYKLYDKCS